MLAKLRFTKGSKYHAYVIETLIYRCSDDRITHQSLSYKLVHALVQIFSTPTRIPFGIPQSLPRADILLHIFKSVGAVDVGTGVFSLKSNSQTLDVLQFNYLKWYLGVDNIEGAIGAIDYFRSSCGLLTSIENSTTKDEFSTIKERALAYERSLLEILNDVRKAP